MRKVVDCPAATRVDAEWFSPAQRATAMGIINAGSAIGAIIAPPSIAVILSYLGWRWIFIYAGILGLLWTVWWWFRYVSPPEDVASCNDNQQIRTTARLSVPHGLRRIDLLRIRESWVFVGWKLL